MNITLVDDAHTAKQHASGTECMLVPSGSHCDVVARKEGVTLNGLQKVRATLRSLMCMRSQANARY
jgi:hypothetical protein